MSNSTSGDNGNGVAQCEHQPYGNHHQYPPAQNQEAPEAKPSKPKYTPEMLREQEALVTRLSQQPGISEELVRRQFERLLEEHKKQLRLMHGEPKSPAERRTPPHHQQPHRGKGSPPQVGTAEEQPNQLRSSPLHKLGPSSLRRIRSDRETRDSQKKNNGLQEAEQAREIMKKFSGAGRFAANWRSRGDGSNAGNNRESPAKEDRPEDPRQQQQQQQQQHTRCSCCHGGPEEKSGGASAADNGEQGAAVGGSTMYWPEIQEPMTFGGVSFMARKVPCVPRVPEMLCNSYAPPSDRSS
ncbi:mediator of RNA polymerase II transcription subunit 25-like [Copidosoma floridanum]|uniref:mediator of RNA polymerase II transcription subunit 25-like n=1 Tax=Copidosoma floridanum TaxID=29053 RepID=UPI0006C94EE7|nr:mediator of RNA polymerase II transcription subunit 25-like [Copidosoma floridanum]